MQLMEWRVSEKVGLLQQFIGLVYLCCTSTKAFHLICFVLFSVQTHGLHKKLETRWSLAWVTELISHDEKIEL